MLPTTDTRPRTPDILGFLLPPVPPEEAEDKDKDKDKTATVSTPTTRSDGGMYYFVPVVRLLRVAALVVTMGTVAGLVVLALVYLTSAIEGSVIRAADDL